MKKTASLIIGTLASLVFFNTAIAKPASNLSGHYLCQGYDAHDGGYENAKVTLSLDSKNSDPAHAFGAYHFTLLESDGSQYTGSAAASGNLLAIYFKNQSPNMLTDQGVGIAVVTHDKNTAGKVTTAFHKFYYEADYHGGNNGSETCVKQDS